MTQMKIKSVYALVESDMNPLPQVSCHRPLPKDDPRAEHGVCSACGRALAFVPPKFVQVMELACSLPCEKALAWHNHFPKEKYVPPAPKETRPKECPECGGKRWYSDYRHTDECSLANQKTIAAPKPTSEPCPECGGPPGKSRGWKHTEDCSMSGANRAKAKAKAQYRAMHKEKPPCPHCGGPARGRGWSHNSECMLSSKG